MSIAALITEGVGPGSTVPFLLTGGLGIGHAAHASVATGGAPLRTRAKKPQRPEWEETDRRNRELEADVRRIYERVAEGKAPAKAVVAEIAETVAPFAAPLPTVTRRAMPLAANVDFSALLASTVALGRFLDAIAKTRAADMAARLSEELRAREMRLRMDAEIEAEDMELIGAFLQSGLV